MRIRVLQGGGWGRARCAPGRTSRPGRSRPCIRRRAAGGFRAHRPLWLRRCPRSPPADSRPARWSPRSRSPPAQVADGTVPFVTVGVANAGGVIRLESFGPLDGPRVGVDAVCLLASVTKPMVATAILREVEAGRLDLTEPIAGWLPGLDRPGLLPFSTWHVLTHTTGLGDADVEGVLMRGGDRAELLRQALAMPQETPPGSAFRYASTTFDLLAEALGSRLGRSLDELLRANVLDPLGMRATTFDPAPGGDVRLAPVRVDLPRLAGVPVRRAARRVHRACGWRAAACGARAERRPALRARDPASRRARRRAGPVAGVRGPDDARGDRQRARRGDRRPARRALRRRLGQAGRREPGLALVVRSRRRDRDAPVGRPGPRSRVRVPERRVGDGRTRRSTRCTMPSTPRCPRIAP